MSKVLRLLIALLVLTALIFAGYELGTRFGKNELRNELIENYSFVREIAELASLEVDGVSTFKATNLANDGSFTDAMKRFFAEKTVRLSVPYVAKYGVDLRDSNMHIERRDSVVIVHLPMPKLLSYELRLDRLDANSHEGVLYSSKADLYMTYQQRLYSEGRKQLENNTVYLKQTQEGIEKLLKQYFGVTGLRVRCIFDLPPTVTIPKN
jgi:hypothetical protein